MCIAPGTAEVPHRWQPGLGVFTVLMYLAESQTRSSDEHKRWKTLGAKCSQLISMERGFRVSCDILGFLSAWEICYFFWGFPEMGVSVHIRGFSIQLSVATAPLGHAKYMVSNLPCILTPRSPVAAVSRAQKRYFQASMTQDQARIGLIVVNAGSKGKEHFRRPLRKGSMLCLSKWGNIPRTTYIVPRNIFYAVKTFPFVHYHSLNVINAPNIF